MMANLHHDTTVEMGRRTIVPRLFLFAVGTEIVRLPRHDQARDMHVPGHLSVKKDHRDSAYGRARDDSRDRDRYRQSLPLSRRDELPHRRMADSRDRGYD
jgi:hypothetical protein